MNKTVKLFEKIAEKKIEFRISNVRTASTRRTSRNEYLIIMPEDYENIPYYYRTLEHEISHVLFTNFDVFNLLEQNFKNNYHLAREILNIIEDYRVDTWWNKLYPGSKVIREKQLRTIFEDHYKSLNPEDYDNPLMVIQMARFYKTGITEAEKYVAENWKELFRFTLDQLAYVEDKDTYGSFIVTLRIMHYLINKSQPDDNLSLKQMIEKVDQEYFLVDDPSFSLDADTHTPDGDTIEKHVLNMTTSEIEKISKERAERVFREIKKKLKKNKYEGIETIYRFTDDLPLGDYTHIKINWTTVKRISSLFRQIKNKYDKEIYDEEGDEIDVNEYVNHLFSTEKPVFKTRERGTKLTVIFLLDVSGSMHGERLYRLKKAIKTLVNAFKMTTGINYRIFAYSDNSFDEVIVAEVNEYDLECLMALGGTPTHLALRYIREKIVPEINDKAILILITDGMPTGENEDPFKATNKEIGELRKVGIQVYSFLIMPHNRSVLRKTFGDPRYWTTNEKDSSLDQDLIKFVRDIVIKNLRR